MAHLERVDGQTTIGSKHSPGSLAVDSKLGIPSSLVLVDSAGVEYVIWIDVTGDLKIGTRANFVTPDAAGTVIGGQS